MMEPAKIVELIIPDDWAFQRTETAHSVAYSIAPPGMTHRLYLCLSRIALVCTGQPVDPGSYIQALGKTALDASCDGMTMVNGVLVSNGTPPNDSSPQIPDSLSDVVADRTGSIGLGESWSKHAPIFAAYDLLKYLVYTKEQAVDMVERLWPHDTPPRRVTVLQDPEIAGGEIVALAFALDEDMAWIVTELTQCDTTGTPSVDASIEDVMQLLRQVEQIANASGSRPSARSRKTSKKLSKTRAKAGRGNRKVSNNSDRVKLKYAFLRKKKQSPDISDNQAAREVALLAGWSRETDNPLKLSEQYPTLRGDDVKRIAGVKK